MVIKCFERPGKIFMLDVVVILLIILRGVVGNLPPGSLRVSNIMDRIRLKTKISCSIMSKVLDKSI